MTIKLEFRSPFRISLFIKLLINLPYLIKSFFVTDKMEIASYGLHPGAFLRLFAPVVIACAITLNAAGQATAVPSSTGSTTTNASVEAPPAQNNRPTTSNYLLRNGDLIRITVFQEEDLTTEVRIPQSGSIMFPLLGPVDLEGKSVADAQEQIRSLLAKKYIINPHVNLAVLEYSKIWATVLGEVQRPGKVEIPVEGGLDLLGAIALSGGCTDNADSSHVNIRRMVNGKDVILNVNVTDLARNPNAKPFLVQPGDAITIPYVKKWLTILGEVRTPGKINLPTEGGLDLLGALALAGGYTADADPEHIDIRRTVDGSDTILTVNATQLARDSNVKPFIVLAGDSITVKYSKLSVTILGEVKTPGKVRIPPEGGLDLLGAVALAGGFTPDANTSHITVRRTVDGKDVIITVNAKELSGNTNVGAFMVQPNDSISVPQRMF